MHIVSTGSLRIFYAVQATGNGHIARAIELMPYLQQYGKVDVFVSGSNSNLQLTLPVQYRSKGLSLFYNKQGGLDYPRIWKEASIARIWKEARQLPVEKYDVVITDFECITALACRLKKIPCINFGHQASFQSQKTPRPSKKDIAGELVLRHYAGATAYAGLHFKSYDHFIFNPVLKRDILDAIPINKGHITVYLSQYPDEVVTNAVKHLKDVRFELFSKTARSVYRQHNITYIPVSNSAFSESMVQCTGVITGAGFETPAEALYLGKKLLCLPIRGQYEQYCNAAALREFNVPVEQTIDETFHAKVEAWLNDTRPLQLQLTHSTAEIVEYVIEQAISIGKLPATTESYPIMQH